MMNNLLCATNPDFVNKIEVESKLKFVPSYIFNGNVLKNILKKDGHRAQKWGKQLSKFSKPWELQSAQGVGNVYNK